jgi:hypothetical protein
MKQECYVCSLRTNQQTSIYAGSELFNLKTLSLKGHIYLLYMPGQNFLNSNVLNRIGCYFFWTREQCIRFCENKLHSWLKSLQFIKKQGQKWLLFHYRTDTGAISLLSTLILSQYKNLKFTKMEQK